MALSESDQAELTRWLDAAHVNQIVNSYFRALDERRFDHEHLRRILATHAEVVRPNGASVVGPDAIADSHARSFARFGATQHLLTGAEVEIDGDIASVRANLVAIHIWKDRPTEAGMLDRSFTAGGVVTAALRRTPDGWRITRTENNVLWRTGHFGDMRTFSYDVPPSS